MEKLNGAQVLVDRLQMHGIRTVFGIPGGNILPFYDALYRSTVRHILAKHEQGAAFMAQGMARITGRPAVCVATSGPGATNLVTALADAQFDSVPLVAITGQVPRSLKGTEAFQEVDMVRLTRGITKRTFYVDGVDQLVPTVDLAFQLAASGRPGPVVIDVPKDVQQAAYSCRRIAPLDEVPVECDLNSFRIREFCRMVHQAARPVIIAGHGVALSGAEPELRQLSEIRRIPVVTTLHGIGCLEPDHPLYLGMAGMHGLPLANHTLNSADLVIALGIRFDDRLTGNIGIFCPNAQFIHIDIDAAQLNRLKQVELPICGDLKMVLQAITPLLQSGQVPVTGGGLGKMAYSPSDFPGHFIRTLAQCLPDDAVVTTDVGQHQMWVAQWFPFKQPGCFLTSGGQGTMGFGLPAAIGAAVAMPRRKVVYIAGDGSLLMNLQEMATLGELGANVTIVVLNNGGLGMVRQQQELFYDNRLSASQLSKPIRFDAVAAAFGIRSAHIKLADTARLPGLLDGSGPLVIDVDTHAGHMVWPMVVPGHSVDRIMGAGKVDI
ncbi:MAG: biosynthetic-type acetolactate synthase large subunit [Breznakibacter sp.]